LIALGASLTLRRGAERRTIPLENFFLAYKRQDRREGEFVEAVHVPGLKMGDLFHVSKISKRFDEDISAVCAAFHLAFDESGAVNAARLAFGGMAATPKRASAAEACLVGRPWSRASAEAAANALAHDFSPLDDWRASAAYRAKVAANLIRRFSLETAQPDAKTRVAGELKEAANA
jgi:xanthine dehydrogenase small subunit